MSILVTGGAGFIGSNFVLEWLRATQESVVNIDALTYAGNVRSLAAAADDERHVFVHGNIADTNLIASLLEAHKPRAVVHFAAESHVDRSIQRPDAFIDTNVAGTFRLLDAVRAYLDSLDSAGREKFRFLNVSTDEVYGSLAFEEPPFSERSRFAPNSPYAASKAAADHVARAYFQTYGVPVISSHCSNNYGPFQFPEKLIPLMILNALDGKPLPVYGDGQQVRDWLHVHDHCAALRALLESGTPGDTYNIGANCERANLEVVHAICTILEEFRPMSHESYNDLIEFVPDRPGHDLRYAIDSSKLQSVTGWRPTWQFEDGLRNTIDWYLNNNDWIQTVITGAYREWINMNYATRTTG